MKLAIIETGANHASLQNAFQRLGIEAPVLSDPQLLAKAERWVLPGVGHGGYAMNKLRSLNLIQLIRGTQKNVLGICLGMQLLFEHLAEGNVQGLGLLPGSVMPLEPNPNFRVPHMGWNSIELIKSSKLLKGLNLGEAFYFTHSFACPDSVWTAAQTTEPRRIPSVVECNNFFWNSVSPRKVRSDRCRSPP